MKDWPLAVVRVDTYRKGDKHEFEYYAVIEITPEDNREAGRGFEVMKLGMRVVYHVWLGPGGTRDVRTKCDCKGGEAYGRCRHCGFLHAMKEQGMIP